MEGLMFFLLIVAVGIMNIACFFVGSVVGQKVSKDEPIEVPKIEPLKAIREHEDRKEAKREQDRLEAIMRNIDNYDGTGQGQEDVPRG